jgi:hypothetical protein
MIDHGFGHDLKVKYFPGLSTIQHVRKAVSWSFPLDPRGVINGLDGLVVPSSNPQSAHFDSYNLNFIIFEGGLI